ncbi:uncharacterized protein LOC122657415 [Telopea speciosissima]|uniref:uncharacterized protein LOC122657415 n=1 Tax=Telopea speciosissima TaxID=54955 RepID=UPI001CC7C00E|nr:uncharacterized protein LOC122657415 [Telopea speciosissima]XP_043708058.1 uncharacterized protein LOC122657415 [Telopea speciosissima]
MATATFLLSSEIFAPYRQLRTISSSVQRTSAHISPLSTTCCKTKKPLKAIVGNVLRNQRALAALIGVGFALTLGGSASAAEFPLWGSTLRLSEPDNALSLPTWAIHVSSVVEWITAMVLVWQYGEKPGNESWKGLSWGMVPLLGGAFCACTWHFFYNSESLEVLVALQAALTVVGNFTMCIAAFRIYKSSQ